MNPIERLRDRELRKAQIEAQMEDLQSELAAYTEFMIDFRRRTGRRHPFLKDNLPLKSWFPDREPEP